MTSFKIRLILVFMIIVFAALNASAAGTAEITNFTPYANCNNTGTIVSHTVVLTSFSGELRMKIYIDGVEINNILMFSSPGPASLTLINNRDGRLIGSSRPAHSLFRVVFEADAVTIFDYSWDCTTGLPPVPVSPSSPDETPVHVIPAFSDGRLNRYDAAAPIAVYPHEGGLAIYAIDANSEGQFVLLISLETIEAVGIPSENTLLGTSEDDLTAAWRLPNGQFMLQAPTTSGKTYYLYFDSIDSQIGYISYEN